MNLPGYDVGAFFAAPGVSDFFRGGDQDPLPRNLGAFGDHVTAIHLLSGIGLALFHKQRTGKGQLVDACLFRAAIFSAANWANVAHPDIKSLPGQHNLNGMKNERSESAAVALMSYQTSDGEWIQLLGLDHAVHVPRIAAATGLPDDTWERMRSREIRAPNEPRAKAIQLIGVCVWLLRRRGPPHRAGRGGDAGRDLRDQDEGRVGEHVPAA